MTAPFTARRAVQRIVKDVERTAELIRASGMPVTDVHLERMLERRVAEAMNDLPADARLYFLTRACEALLAGHGRR